MKWHSSASASSSTTRAELSVARLLRWLALAPLAAWLVGLVLFVRADGSMQWQLPRYQEPLGQEHNLALYRFGPTVRASSYMRDPYSQHHPGFLVDGRLSPSEVEKWTSHATDKAPWTEILFREPHDVSRIVITHAGKHELAAYTAKKYRIICLAHGKAPAPLTVENNELPLAIHPLSCEHARGIRIEWSRSRKKYALVRVYEVEVWGR